ncbi:Maf family protein [Porticoccaceae bacterium LTM1]|nr:Maf family protein [Porticoccaceae bacterium LTM1]
MTAPVDFILASGSPRRRELLEQIGACFTVAPVDIAEHPLNSESPRDYVTRLALEKAQAGYVRQKEPRVPVLGSDTAVVLGDRIYGKPANEAEAVEILMSLSGCSHTVMSGVAVVDGAHHSICLVETEVHFRELTEQQCRQYWATGEPADKAGGYGIQGLAAVFVDRISGSYSNVVGLPLAETADLLRKFGIEVWKGV